MKTFIQIKIAICCGILMLLITLGILLHNFVIIEAVPSLPVPETETESEIEYNIELEPMNLTYIRCDEPTAEQCGQAQYFDVPLSHELQDYIFEKCEEYDVPAALIIAMIDQESKFHAQIKSEDGRDYGLMQIRDINHASLRERLGVSDFLNPFENVYAGIVMLSDAVNIASGDIPLGLMVYNNGQSKAEEKWREGIYSTPYTEEVLSLYSYYSEQIKK